MTERTLTELALLCGAELDGDGSRRVRGPASLRDASECEVSFLANPKYRAELAHTRAAGVLVEKNEPRTRSELAFLRCIDPSAAFTRVVQAFAAPEWRPSGQHASAVVDASARIALDAAIGAHVVVGPDCVIGARAVLHAGVVLGRGARIGEDSVLYPRVVLYDRVEVGARCIVHAGTVLGSDGFGFEPTREGWRKIPQCGNVVVEDDVEIGANSAIDRGRFGATHIGRGVKIDNLVHVAHNVVVGESALLIAQVGVAGSTRVGARAILAGQAGVTGHVEIGAGARVGGGAGVFNDVAPGTEVLGYPARPRREALRQFALIGRLPELVLRLQALERRAGLRGTEQSTVEEHEA